MASSPQVHGATASSTIPLGAPAYQRSLLPTITPHQVAVCFLIKGYLSPGGDDPGGNWTQRQALGDALLTVIRGMGNGVRELSIWELAHTLQIHVTAILRTTQHADQGQYGASVASALHIYMCSGGTVDRLIVLFDQLARMVTTSTNARAEESVGADDNSVMGFFLRRCWCDFTALSFEDLCTLASACERYGVGFKPYTIQPAMEINMKTYRSRDNVLRYLSTGLLRLDSLLGKVNIDTLEYNQAVMDLEGALPGGLLPSHLVAASVARNRRNVIEAVERVHKTISETTLRDSSWAMPLMAKDTSILQNSALLLASTYARLGHSSMAMTALDEAMRVAQQAGDDIALVHTLALLCSIMETATPGTMDQITSEDHVDELETLLQRCLCRAEALSVPQIAAYAHLSLARTCLLSPTSSETEAIEYFRTVAGLGIAGSFMETDPTERPPIERALEKLREAESSFPKQRCSPSSIAVNASRRYVQHLHAVTSLCAAVPVCPPPSSGLACVRILKGLGELFSPIPQAFGQLPVHVRQSMSDQVRKLANSSCLLSSTSLELHGSRRLAQAHLLAFLSTQSSVEGDGNDVAVGLSHLAVSIADSHGYAAARQVIELIEKRMPDSKRLFALEAALLTIEHRHACHRRDIRAALVLASKLIGCADSTDQSRIGYRIAGLEARARSYLAGQYFAEGEKVARRALSLATSTHQSLDALRLLILVGRIHYEGGNFETALPYAISALVQTRAMHAQLLWAEAALLLGCILYEMAGHQEEGVRYVKAAMPLVMGHGGLELRARARLALAEMMELYDRKCDDANICQERLKLLELIKRDYTKLEDWQEISYCEGLTAELYERLGDADGQAAALGRAQKFYDLQSKAFDSI
jgi:tetratricopeptide (TPR) repeat protein